VESKHIIFIAALFVVVPLGSIVTTIWRRAREGAFFLMLFGTVLDTQKGDINFISREWYRGTTRGIEVSWLDLIALMLIFGTLISSMMSGKKSTKPFWPPGAGPLIVFAAYAGVTSFFADPSLFALFEFTKIVRGIILFFAAALFVRGRKEIWIALVAVLCALTYEGLVVLQDRYIYGIHRVGGTLQHPNALSFYCCVTAPVALAAVFSDLSTKVRAWCIFAATLGFVSVLMTISRTGIAMILLVLAGTTFACVKIRINTKLIIRGGIAAIILVGMLIRVSGTIMDRVGSKEADKSTRSGYYNTALALAADHPIGVGLNNWSWAVSEDYALEIMGLHYVPYTSVNDMPDRRPIHGMDTAQAPPAHSLLALTVGELGWPGLFLMVVIWARWFWIAGAFLRKRTANLISRFGVGAFFGLLGAFGQGLSEWTFRQTNVFFLVHVLMGATAAIYVMRKREAKAPRRPRATRLRAA